MPVVGTSLTFTYDGNGNWVTKAVTGGVRTSFAYDTNHKLPALLDAGDRLYIWGLGNKRIYSIKRSNTADVWVDHRDGPRAIPEDTDTKQNRVPRKAIGTRGANGSRTDASPR